MKHNKKVDMIVDLQFGSTGKGLLAGYLATTRNYDVCVTANMPNAGHTFIDANGNKMIHKVLPNGVVGKSVGWALIGPGAVFCPRRLNAERETLRSFGYGHFSVAIHPNAIMLKPAHREAEGNMGRIGSTMQGSAEAMIEKIHRPEYPVTVGQRGHPLAVSAEMYDEILQEATSVLAEGAQGFSLGINQRFYPYCTSRECTPSRFLSDMAIPHALLRTTIGTARVHPIRPGRGRDRGARGSA